MNPENIEANMSTYWSSSSLSSSLRPPLIRYPAGSPDFSPGPPALTQPSPVFSFTLSATRSPSPSSSLPNSRSWLQSPSMIQFNNGHDYTPHELEQISASSPFTQAVSDPVKKAKSMEANRKSAARSKERKKRYLEFLEEEVKIHKEDKASMSQKISNLEMLNNMLVNDNKALKNQVEMQNQFDISNLFHQSKTYPDIGYEYPSF